MPAQSKQPEADNNNAVWYLGIDVGTSGVSAVLLNYSTGQRYPLHWSHGISIKSDDTGTVTSQLTSPTSSEAIVRLPAVTYSGSAVSKLAVKLPTPILVGSLASKLVHHQPGLFLDNFKPYLNLGIPYYYPKRRQWEPTLQRPNQQTVSLYYVQQALQALLATVTPSSTLPHAAIGVGATDLEVEVLATALQQLEGVILGCPADWGDTYRFNVREAVLAAKLVKSPEQIFFLEDAIACILAALPTPPTSKGNSEEEVFTTIPQENSPPASPSPPVPPLSHSSLHGGTLVINAGATTTEIALVNLPDDLQDLTYSDFSAWSLPYAGKALDQDIFCQLLYPQLSPAQRQQLSTSGNLELPQPGQPDPQLRDRLALLLQNAPFGQALLKTASCLKLILQHKQELTLDLGKHRWTLTRQDLENKVFQPFIQQLNQQLNARLIETGILEQRIHQIFFLGGTARIGMLATWIQQRFPNATLIRETDSLGESWVAAGLATLPLYPQVLNRLRQQYSDYFLLLELLRAFSEAPSDAATHPYTLEEILQQLERRGLNTIACYERLVRLVDGQLPDGLVPFTGEASLLSPLSKHNPLYTKLAASRELFSREGDRLYHPNIKQQEYLHQYLKLALSHTYQKIEEPVLFRW